MKEVIIASAVRTPIGSFGGSLASLSAPELGAIAIGGSIKAAKISPNVVDEVIMGNVLTAGEGQAPARQATLKAGLPDTVPATTVNKVCASGMKSVMYAANLIQSNEAEVVIAGGMESMSNVPFYLPNMRNGNKLGHVQAQDAILRDGLVDAFNDQHMGICAETCAAEYNFSREDQDNFAISSYQRSLEARDKGWFDAEMLTVKIRDRKGNVTEIKSDEELNRVDFDKMRTLKPVFQKDGTVTAANASSINDGAAALVIMSADKARELGVKPLARILGQASAAKDPNWFTTAPADAIPIALKRAGLTLEQIDLFEINEAFSVVSLANNKLLALDASKVNIHGGAVSIGHPIGCSGARIIVTLLHALIRTGGRYGCAGICNGGGGASAIVIERLD
jgi:acetyl-CoA C-acetyltransferase